MLASALSWCGSHTLKFYHIYLALRQDFTFSRMYEFCYNMSFTLPEVNNPKDFDPFYKIPYGY